MRSFEGQNPIKNVPGGPQEAPEITNFGPKLPYWPLMVSAALNGFNIGETGLNIVFHVRAGHS